MSTLFTTFLILAAYQSCVPFLVTCKCCIFAHIYKYSLDTFLIWVGVGPFIEIDNFTHIIDAGYGFPSSNLPTYLFTSHSDTSSFFLSLENKEDSMG